MPGATQFARSQILTVLSLIIALTPAVIAEAAVARSKRGWLTLILLVFAAIRSTAAAEEPKRLLLLQSFGPQIEPWAYVVGHFREQLVKLSPNKIYFSEFFLQGDRSQQKSDEEGRFLVNYLASQFGARKLDLIVAIGGPAISFVQQYRPQLLPSTPLVLADEKQLTIRYSALTPNDAAIPVALDFKNLIENVLQVRPDTTHIAWVVGASPVERMWTEELRRVSQPFADKISFEYLNDLRFDDLLSRVSSLPPHSAVFYISLYVDSAGVPWDSNIVLPQLREATNSPIFSYVEDFLGQGIVGGPMLSSKDVARHLAEASVRILGGEIPLHVELPPLAPGPPQYDWRELRHWNIGEDRLPAGSIVRFREPSVWEQYRWEIALVCAALLLQTALISGLLFEHRRRKFAEVRLRQGVAQQAHANRYSMAGELTATISHELNQPLAAILTNIETLDFMLQSPAPNLSGLREIVADIRRDDQRAADVIRHLRTMLKKSPLELDDLDLNNPVRDTVGFLAILAAARHVDLTSSLAAFPLSVQGDRVHLQQVISNLVMNAMDAMSAVPKDQRKLAVATARVDSFAELSVADTGPGIPADKLEKIFDPFFSTKESGMGMGLSIARTLVEAHRGELTAENRAGGGAVFRMRLPLSALK
jgi:signal transduction histidine kinase